MSAYLSGGVHSLCEVLDNHAGLIDLSLENVQITSNGVLTLTKVDGTTFTNNIPLFSDFVINGLALTLGNTSGLYTNLSYTAGAYQLDAIYHTISPSGAFTLNDGDVTYPRIDIIYVDTSNSIHYLAGTASSSPIPPSAPGGSLVIAEISVAPGSNSTTPGYDINLVNFKNTNNINNGSITGQMPYWDNITKKWIPLSVINSTSFSAKIGSSLGSEILNIGGRVFLNNTTAPGTTTNVLWAQGGNLYWNGIQLDAAGTLPTGTIVNTTLRWSGSAWVEDTNFRILDAASNFGAGTNFGFGSGTQNTFFGRGTLTAITSGSGNSVFGLGAGALLTSGSSNILIGRNSGGNLTTGSNNTGVGLGTLQLATTGFSNIAIGAAAGANITTAIANIMIGVGAGLSLTTGTGNILIGALAQTTSTGTANIVIGTSATSTGSNRVVLGSNSTIINDVFLGRNDATTITHSLNLQISPLTGSNAIGGNLFIRPQFSTGTGRSGSIDFQTSDASGSSSSTPNAPVTKLKIEEDQITFNAGRIEKFSSTQTSLFTPSVYEYIYLLDSSGGSFTIDLDPTVRPGTTWIFKDVGGSATTNPITLDPSGAVTIDGLTTFVMDANYMGLKVLFDGSSFYIIL